jgi:hypothetical protein
MVSWAVDRVISMSLLCDSHYPISANARRFRKPAKQGVKLISITLPLGDDHHGDGVKIKDVTIGPTTLLPWSQGNKTSVSYVVVHEFPSRVVGALPHKMSGPCCQS